MIEIIRQRNGYRKSYHNNFLGLANRLSVSVLSAVAITAQGLPV
jgi:hypothetical protein